MTVLVMAKAPVPGQVKTRLCPPLNPGQAAAVAAAALLDTMDAIDEFQRHYAAGAANVLALSGQLTAAPDGPAIAHRLLRNHHDTAGWVRIAQYGHSFAQRLVQAHEDTYQLTTTGSAVLQIGMDTPQISGELLADCARRLHAPDVDAVLGLANDGGWWALGARSPQAARVLHDIPMSTSRTAQDTLDALHRIGLRVGMLPTLTDADTLEEAHTVAQLIPDSRFAAALRTAQRQGPQ